MHRAGMSFEAAGLAPGTGLEQPRRPVRRARREVAATRGERHGMDAVRVIDEPADLAAELRLPEVRRAIGAAGEQVIAIGRDGQRVHAAAPPHVPHDLPAVANVEEPREARGRQQMRARGMERDAAHPLGVSRHATELPATRAVPNPCRLVGGTRRDLVARS